MNRVSRGGSAQGTELVRLVASWLTLLILALVSAPVAAQAEMRLQLGAREIEVGESVEVELTAMAPSDESPSSPELVVPPGFKVRGPQVGTRQQVSITGFQMVRRAGLTATWRVTATRPGLFSLGPAAVQVSGSRQQTAAVSLKVVPAGQLAKQRQRRRRDPFASNNPFDDLFNSMRRGSNRTSQLPQAPAALALKVLPDQTAFLRAVVSPRTAVVGQQITLSVYAYGAKGLFQEAAGSREASYPDFLAQRIVEDPSEQPVYQFTSRGQQWIVVKIREVALFPLRPGNLEIGATQFGFLGRRYAGRASRGLLRKSQTHQVVVRDPPLANRPPGYGGEVGDFRLFATVEPREVKAGDSVSVNIRVTGRGRMPARINLPEQAGVRWDEPTLRDTSRRSASVVAGERTFQFIVRLTEAGDVDLGSVKLPYFDPNSRRYGVARAVLGRVLVAQASRIDRAAASSVKKDRLSDVVRWRSYSSRRAGKPVRGSSLAWEPWFWWLLLACPLLTALLMAVVRLWARGKSARAAKNESLTFQAQRAAKEARQALDEQHLDIALQRMERSVYCAVQEATGVRGRGILRSRLAPALGEAGLSSRLAEEVVRVLDSFEAVRFSEQQTQGEVLMQQVSELLANLLNQPRGRRSSAPVSVGLVVFLLASVCVLPCRAEQSADQSAEQGLWLKLQTEMEKGNYSLAIDQLELWSDQGRSGRDLSFNRGVAYLGRAESSASRAADWGQAAAAFQEASLLDPQDEQALQWAQAVRTRLSEERAKLRGSRVEARPRLLRALVDLIGESWWAGLSILGSTLLTLGLWLRWMGRGRVAPVVTVLMGSTGLCLMLGAGAMTAVSLHFRTDFVSAVVIAEEAKWLNSSGMPLRPQGGPSVQGGTGNRIPMGSLVHISENQGALARVQWGDREGYVRATTLRRLAQ